MFFRPARLHPSLETQGLLVGTMRFFRVSDIFGENFTSSAEGRRSKTISSSSSPWVSEDELHPVNTHFIMCPFCFKTFLVERGCADDIYSVGPYAFFRLYHFDAYSPHTGPGIRGTSSVYWMDAKRMQREYIEEKQPWESIK